jgi:hypothetical protein
MHFRRKLLVKKSDVSRFLICGTPDHEYNDILRSAEVNKTGLMVEDSCMGWHTVGVTSLGPHRTGSLQMDSWSLLVSLSANFPVFP